MPASQIAPVIGLSVVDAEFMLSGAISRPGVSNEK
jgi:hypothetical protein